VCLALAELKCVRPTHACKDKLWLGQTHCHSGGAVSGERSRGFARRCRTHMLSFVTFKCQLESDAGDVLVTTWHVRSFWMAGGVLSVLCSLSDDTYTRLQHHTVSSRCVAVVRIGSPVLLCGMRATVWRLSPLSCAPFYADLEEDCEQKITWCVVATRVACMCAMMRAVTDATRVALASAPPSAANCRSGGL
jgi:hypothetical protein